MSRRRLHAYTLLIITTIIWGIAGPVIKFTLEGLPPFIFLTYRFGISALIALAIILASGFKVPKNPKTLLLLLIYSFLVSTVALGLLFLGFEKTTAVDASLIGATAPLFIAAAGAIFLHEHVTKKEKIGTSIAFVGTAITIAEPMLKNGDGLGGVSGNLLVLASVIVGTATAVLGKMILRRGVSSTDATNTSFLIGFLTITPLTLVFHSPSEIITAITSTPLAYHLGVIFMALLSGNLAYWLWMKAQKTIEIGEAGLFGYLYPLFATPLAVVWLNEKITLPFIVGAAVIAIGVVIAETKKIRYN